MDFGQLVSSDPSTGAAPNTAPDQQPLDYGDIVDKHRAFIAKFPHLDGQVGVADYAQAMNEQTGTNQYSAGLGPDNAVRRAFGDYQFRTKHLFGGLGGGEDKGFDLPAAGQAVAEGGAKLAGLPEGYVHKAGEVGKGMAPLPLDIGISMLTGPAEPVTLGTLMGGRTYADTGSISAAAISAFTPKILEGAGNLAEQGALKGLGGGMRGLVRDEAGQTLGSTVQKLADVADPEIQKYLHQYVGNNITQKGLGLLARQVGMFLGFEGVGAGQDIATGHAENLKTMADRENLFGAALGQLPFAGMDALHIPGGRSEVEKTVGGLEKGFKENAKTQFEKQTGRVPSGAEVNAMLDRAKGKPGGTVIASKVEVNWGPLQTSSGEVPMQEAVEQAKKTMQIAGTDAHENTIATVLRGMSENNPHWDRDTLVGNAVGAIAELDKTDAEHLSRYGMSKDEQKQQIADATDPTIERTKAREDQIVQAVKNDPALQALMGQVVEQVHPRRTKKEAKFGALDQTAERKTEGTSPELDEETDTSDRMVIGTGELAEADYAMRNAVEREYQKAKANGVDTSDPQWQKQLLGTVRSEMNKAKMAWSRNRGTEETAGTFDSESDARSAMDKLQPEQPREKPANFFVEKRGDKWHVKKQNFVAMHSIEGEHERTSNEGTMESALNEDMKEQMGVSAEHLQKLGETPNSFAALFEPVEHAFKALEAIKDPGTREGARAGITHNVLDAFAALSPTKLEELILNGRTETETGRRASVQDKATKQARMVAYIQFLRDGGVVNVKTDKATGNVSARATDTEQLARFNDYVKQKNPTLAYADPLKWNQPSGNGLNFWEQFRLVSNYVSKNFVDLRDVARRLKGDMVMLPRGVVDKNLDNVLVDPKVWKGLVGKKKNFWNSPGVVEDGIITAWDKNMSPVRVPMKNDVSPLMTLILEGAKRELTVSAGSLVDYLNKYHAGEVDSRHLELLKKLTDSSNSFGRNLRVGFGVSRDGSMKGMYHYNSDNMTNTGIMLSPFSADPSGRYWKLLDSPQDIAPHFLHEVSHALTVFAYHSDPAIRQEVDKIYASAKAAYEAKTQAHQLAGFTLPTLHGLSDPKELLATVWHEQPLRDFLGSVQDTLGAKPTTLLGRLFDTINRIMSKWLGKDQQGSLLQRLQEVTLQTMQKQTELYPKFGAPQTEPDLYGQLQRHVFAKGQSDVMEGQSVDRSKPIEQQPTEPSWTGLQGEPLSEKQQATLQAILSRNPELEAQAKAATKQEQVAKNFELKLEYLRKQGIKFNEGMTSAIQAQHAREGNTLASRDPMPLVYSMAAHSTHLSELGDEVRVAPTNPLTFMKQFGPVASKYGTPEQDPTLGLRYKFSKQQLATVPDELMAQLPRPPIHQWTYSAFETVRELAIRRGDSPADANALAAYVLNTAALLKGSEDNIWLHGHDSEAFGRAVVRGQSKAFLGTNAVALFPGALRNTERMGEVLRHESFHTVEESQDVQKGIETIDDMFDSLTQEEKSSLMWSLTNLSGRIKGTNFMDGMGSDTNPREFGAQLFGRIGDQVVGMPRPNGLVMDMMRYAHDDISSMLRTTVTRRAAAIGDLEQQIEETSRQFGVSGNRLSRLVADIKSTFKGMARDALKIESDVSDFMTMRNLFPDTYQGVLRDQSKVGNLYNRLSDQKPQWDMGTVLPSKVTDMGKDILGHIGLLQETNGVKQPSLWSRKIGQFAHMVQEYPALRPFYDALAASQGLARLATIQLQTALLGATSGDKLMDSSKVKMQNKFNQSQKLQDAFSKIAFQMQGAGDDAYEKELNAAGGDTTQVPKIEPLDARKRQQLYDAAGITDVNERKILDHVFEGTRNQVNMANTIIAADQMQRVVKVAAMAIGRNTNLSSEQSRWAAQLIHDAWEAQDKGDINTALQLQGQFKAMVPDLKLQAQVFDLVRSSRDDIKQLVGMMNAKEPYFMSTRSPGRFAVYFKNADGKLQHWYAKDSVELNKFITKNNVNLSDPSTKLIYPNDNTQGLSPDIVQRANEGFEKVKGRLQGLFGQEEGNKLAQLLDWVGDFQNEFSSANVLSMSKERRAVDPDHPDYPLRLEQLNMFQAHQQYVRSVVQAAKNSQMKLEKELALNDPSLKTQPVLRNIMEDHLAGVLKPDTEIGRGIQMTNMVYFVSLAPVLAMVEPFQQLTAAVPQLIREGQTIKAAYGRIAQANKLALGARLNKDRYVDKDLDNAVKQARAMGVIDRGLFAELDADHELQMTNRLRVSSGSKPLDLFDIVKSRLFQLGQTLVRWHGVVPAYNSEVAFVAAYKMYREAGRTSDQAFADARLFKDTTMLGGGKVNRPGIFGGNQSDFQRTAAQTMWSLQSYAVSQMTLMGRLIKESSPGRGLTAAQSVQARKAALAMLATQWGLAGALGMPFVGGGIAILQKMFPQLQVEKDVRDFLAHITGDTDAHGNWLGAALTTGVPSTMSQAPDVGARMSLGGVLGVSPYNGFSLQNVAGPAASMIGSAFKAITDASQGQFMQSAHDAMPKGFSRMWDAFQQGSEFRDPKGRLLADDLTPIETVMRAAGFTPARIGRLQTAERLASQALEADKVDDAIFRNKQVQLLVAGDAQQVQMNLIQRAQATLPGEGNPREVQKRAVELANQVAAEYEKQTMPVDPRQYVDKYSQPNSQAIQRTVGEQSTAPLPTQTARLTQRAGVLQQLGAPTPHPTSFGHAQAVDHILQMYPFMNPSDAARMVSHHQAVAP